MPASATRLERALGVIALVLLALAGMPAQAGVPALERCGWLENPTPANVWFTDRDGAWVVAAQGGHQAEGDWPASPRYRWVRTNGNYGYGCVCMTVVANAGTMTVERIVSGRSMPLGRCRADRALKEPKAG